MFLPVSKSELSSAPDFIVVSGDAYVDHPSFGHALIARVIESQGFSVAVLPQPVTDDDYVSLGAPKIAFMVTSGVVDSMVNNYTVAKRKRTTDDYSEGGIAGRRPDRALTVYCKNLKRLFPGAFIVGGGLEGSLRRFAHYDYWSDTVMPSILIDAPMDLLVYGMGERPLLDILSMAGKGIPLDKIKSVPGTAYLADSLGASPEMLDLLEGRNGAYQLLSSFERVKDKTAYAKAFSIQHANVNPIVSKPLIQKQSNTKFVVQNVPPMPLSEKEMDFVYSLPFERKPHPMYTKKVPAIEEVEFSITAHRGCYGNCAFCALTYHQGRAIQSRSRQSIVSEGRVIAKTEGFKGYIHDVGGPTANFHAPSCDKQVTKGICADKDCIGYKPCANLKVDHSKYLEVLRELRTIDGVKKVFIRSGIRFDYLMMDSNPAVIEEIISNHISGQLKVAPEHCSEKVLKVMNKPDFEVYRKFSKVFKEKNKKLKLEQFLVPYFISSHPGCTVADAVMLTEYLMEIGYMPKQVQDFYPTPSTKATTMYFTGLDPDTMQPVYVARTSEEKAMQRALLQYRLPANRELCKKAFKLCGKEHLSKRL